MTGRVSTIIPVHNRAGRLREAVGSVLAQSHEDIEIIIVDDGSTDDTGAVADRLAAEHPDVIRVIHQDNAGPGAARQAGLEAARGAFIQYLDSDDLLLPEKFALQVAGLEANPNAGISYGLTMVEDVSTGERRPTHGTDVKRDRLFPWVINDRLWATLTPLWRRSVCEAIGPWSRRRILEDWDYDCRAGLLKVELQYCEQPLGVKRHGFSDHAGLEWQRSRHAMLDRVQVYLDVVGYVRQAGIKKDSPDMERFSRTLFWMARIAGCAGLETESRQLLDAAREITTKCPPDMRLYDAIASSMGEGRTARLFGMLERWRG